VSPEPIPSPCRQICRLGADGRCDGCGRTIDEIGRWTWLAPLERAVVMERVRDWRVRGPGADPADPR
jgi:uncharacterized protein